jgi:hydrogenase maturation protease
MHKLLDTSAERRIQMSTLVVAVGNPLRGDDGVGLAVLEALRGHDLPPHVVLEDGGTSGLELVLTMTGYQRVIIVDAADIGCAPGTWRLFGLDEVRLQGRDLHLGGTLHYAGLPEALALAEALGMLPPEIIIVGVQPGRVDWEAGLSEAVHQAVPAVCAVILAASARL